MFVIIFEILIFVSNIKIKALSCKQLSLLINNTQTFEQLSIGTKIIDLENTFMFRENTPARLFIL